MSTPEAQNNRTEAEGVGNAAVAQPHMEPAERPDHYGVAPASHGKMHWLTRASYLIGAVAAVGLLVTLVGAYIVEEDSVVVTGAIIITLTAIAWIVGTVVMGALMIGPLFSAFRRILLSRQPR